MAASPQPAPRSLTLRLHAGEVLNTDADGRSLSVVARLYKLREKQSFEAASYSDFQDLAPARAPAFFSDVVDVQEVVFTPGRQYDVVESFGAEARYFAVVVLFRSPAQARWRFVFDVRSADSAEVAMGIHACALSVSAGKALDIAPEMLRVAGVHCPES